MKSDKVYERVGARCLPREGGQAAEGWLWRASEGKAFPTDAEHLTGGCCPAPGFVRTSHARQERPHGNCNRARG